MLINLRSGNEYVGGVNTKENKKTLLLFSEDVRKHTENKINLRDLQTYSGAKVICIVGIHFSLRFCLSVREIIERKKIRL